jgi:hypothetical protein
MIRRWRTAHGILRCDPRLQLRQGELNYPRVLGLFSTPLQAQRTVHLLWERSNEDEQVLDLLGV